MGVAAAMSVSYWASCCYANREFWSIAAIAAIVLQISVHVTLGLAGSGGTPSIAVSDIYKNLVGW